MQHFRCVNHLKCRYLLNFTSYEGCTAIECAVCLSVDHTPQFTKHKLMHWKHKQIGNGRPSRRKWLISQDILYIDDDVAYIVWNIILLILRWPLIYDLEIKDSPPIRCLDRSPITHRLAATLYITAYVNRSSISGTHIPHLNE